MDHKNKPENFFHLNIDLFWVHKIYEENSWFNFEIRVLPTIHYYHCFLELIYKKGNMETLPEVYTYLCHIYDYILCKISEKK